MTASTLRGLASIIPASDPANVPLGRQSILLYGQAKIGKTTEAARFSNALFLDTEQGTLNLAVPTFESLIGKDRVNDPISKWEDVKKATDVLSKIDNAEGTVVVDTIPEAYALSREYVLRTNGWDHETDGAYGKGWKAVKDEFATWMRQLRTLPYGIIFIAHETEMEIETPTEKYQKKSPRMDKGCREIVEPFVDHIWYAHTRFFKGVGEVRVIQTKNDKNATAGERGNPVRLPLYVEFDYDKILGAWNGSGNTNQGE